MAPPEPGLGDSNSPGDAGPGLRRHGSKYLPLVVFVAAVALAVDQITKWWALENLTTQMIDVFWTLRFNLVLNTGSAFSLGQGLGPWIGILALVVVGVLLWTGRSVGTKTGAIGLGLILGGALGNLADRAFRSGDGFLGGGVIDFIDFQWWPVFNVADSCVVVGAVILLLSTWMEGRQGAEVWEGPTAPEDSTEQAT